MEIYQELLYVHIMTRASANIDSVPRAQGKIKSNMAYPDMFVQLATRNRVATRSSRRHAAGPQLFHFLFFIRSITSVSKSQIKHVRICHV